MIISMATSSSSSQLPNNLSPLAMFANLSIFLLLLLPCDVVSTSLVSSSTICKSTPDPSFCRRVLPNNQSSDVYYYGRYSLQKSLSRSRKFSNLIDKYLSPSRRRSLSLAAVQALEDCRFLAGLNVDFLQSSCQTINNVKRTLPAVKADDVQTLLSAILTNEQTCMDGISSTASPSGLAPTLQNDTKMYSVSLALATEGWVPKKRKAAATWNPGKKQLAFGNGGRLPLKMSSGNRAVYESVSGRKLLEAAAAAEEVLVKDVVVVAKNGSGNFSTINDAVKAAPNNSKSSEGYFLIYVTAGVYEEYVSIATNKRYLMLIGDGINQTIITGNRSVGDGWTTFNSATFIVTAPGFVAVNITVRNTAGAIKHQAVALRSGADLSTFYRCSFEGYQDTLYTHSMRQFYRECDIYGTVDFIFGNAAVVLQNCNIFPRKPMSGQFNAITAQGRTDPNQNTGTSIHNCTIKAADDLASSNTSFRTYLGRPWKEYSRTVYMQSFMDGLIEAVGWREWSGDFALDTL